MAFQVGSAPGGYRNCWGDEDEGEDELDPGYSNLDLVNEEVELDFQTRAQTFTAVNNHLALAPKAGPRKSVPAREQPPSPCHQKKISLGNDLPLMRGRLTAQSTHGRSPGARRKLGSVGIGKQHTIAAPSTGLTVKRTIECSVCYEPFGDLGDSVPRSLDCGHSFCTGERLKFYTVFAIYL